MSENTNKFIAVTYRLYTLGDNGKELVEEATIQRPFSFISGFGLTLAAFEGKLLDLAKGDHFEFTLNKDEAYGDYESDFVHELSREVFTIDGHFDHERVKMGAMVPLQDPEGQYIWGKVIGMDDKIVKLDFNHPFAGHDVTFEGEIIESRKATEEELKQLIEQLTGKGGCHCSGGCEGCGGHCGEEGCGEGECGDGCHCNEDKE